MTKKIVNDIHEYIKFLEQCGYIISISFMKNHFSPFTEELLQYDFHPHPICNYLKQNRGTEGRCVHNKYALEKRELTEPYYACCYAGVEEFLAPLRYEDALLCCIHISGYRGVMKKSELKMNEISKLCSEQFCEMYNELSRQVPSMEKVLSFVKPLQYMLIELYESCRSMKLENEGHPNSDNLYVKALQYIHDNYPNSITCDVIAKELQYSPSYVRYIFKREGNISVQAKINEIRLTNAKRLLRGTNMSITEVAFSVGFADSNYFSSFFKRKEKVTPREYRNKVKS